MIAGNKGGWTLEMVGRFRVLDVLVKSRNEERKSSDSEIDTVQSSIGVRHSHLGTPRVVVEDYRGSWMSPKTAAIPDN
jgi:hypothetical protein